MRMRRPGFVLEVDERTPPTLVSDGDRLRLERFPLGTRVVYPPDSLPALPDVDGAVVAALEHPYDSEPLSALLRPGMRLTIAFDDLSMPLPPMRAPDVRGRVVERVLEMAAAAGVDDVQLVAATALHRRMTSAELRHVLGERVYRSFAPSGDLYNFDAEDPDALTLLGTTEHGEEVEVSRRAAESDLLVYVNVNIVAMEGGHKSTGIGLASYRSLRHHHNPHTLEHSRSFMDPSSSALHASATRISRLLQEHVRVFHVETTVNNDVFPSPYGFVNTREWEWSLRDQVSALATKRALDLAPATQRHRALHRMRGAFGVTSVQAGSTDATHAVTLENVHAQQLVEVQGDSDVLVTGVPFVGPYNVSSTMNPVLAMCMALGYFFNLYRGRPLVRPGGAMIVYHPLRWEFDRLHHPSYVDFFEEVLAATRDPHEMSKTFEEAYATDPWYRHLYRTSHAYHGVHPFYMWYWGAHAMQHLGDVVWVGADRRTAAHMGFQAASTLADALAMVSGSVGTSPSITYLHVPPFTMADVR